MGAIIGKGGKRIGEIRMMSGCNIHVERADEDSKYGMRRLTLKGDRQKITMAAFLINQTISSFSTAEPKVASEEGVLLSSFFGVKFQFSDDQSRRKRAATSSYPRHSC